MLAENLTSETVERNYRSASRQPLRIVDEEAVAVAVALNELVFNALKHKTTEAGEKKVRITLREEEEYAEIRITNHGLLPARFDFARGLGVSDGLDLVRTLILQPGSVVNFYSRDEEVEVVLTLSPPLLAASVVEDTPFE